MTREEAIEKAKKLLRLGESDNAHESAAAIARAQVLLEKFEMEVADLDLMEDDEIANTWMDTNPNGKQRLYRWRVHLVSAIARANGCEAFTAGKHVCFVGRRQDAAAAIAIYREVAAEVERITSSYCQGLGVGTHNSFKMGMVGTITYEVHMAREELKRQMEGHVSERALTVVDTRAADAKKKMYEDVPNLKEMKYQGHISDRRAEAAGARAGSGVYARTSSKKIES